MSKLFSLVLCSLFSLVTFTANAADCAEKIKADKPLWGTIGTIIDVKVSPLTDKYELEVYGPIFKHHYAVKYDNGIIFRSYVIFREKNMSLKSGYKFAWVPVAIATEGRVNDPNNFTPTAYDHDCRPLNLDASWTKDQIVNGL